MIKIKQFIQDNDLSLEEGTRNSTIVTLIGYSQYLDLSKKQLEESLREEINNDDVIQEEIDRLWSYCKSNNYKKYWLSEIAKNQYKF